MEINLCYGCMELLEAGRTVCPHCGFDNSEEDGYEALSKGTILKGKYLLGKVSDRDDFGFIYIGMDLPQGKKVMIKEFFPLGYCRRSLKIGRVMIPDYADYSMEDVQKDRDYYITMAKVQKELESPNIKPVRDYFFENNTLYIVRDFVDGISLQREMEKSGGKLPWKRVLLLLMPLLPEIEKIHKKAMFDLKIRPCNMLLCKYDSHGSNIEKIVLTDIGFYHKPYDPEGDLFMFAMDRYLNPIELFMAKQKSGPYTDVYSICAIMYAAITGEKPPTAAERLMDGRVLKPFSSFGLKVPPVIENAVRRGLEIKSGNRTQTMMELYNELKAAL